LRHCLQFLKKTKAITVGCSFCLKISVKEYNFTYIWIS
jgi:hypothetical protein